MLFRSTMREAFQEILEEKIKNKKLNFRTALKNSRIALSEFVGCDEGEILFFQNPTSAIANVIHSLRLNIGDEVLMTDHEYGAMIRAWNIWGKKNGVDIIQQKIPLPIHSEDDFLDAFWKGVTERTKVIFISQITSPTALIFPIKRIIDRANTQEIGRAHV